MLSSQPPYHTGTGDGEDPDRSTSASMTTAPPNNTITTSSTLNGVSTTPLHLSPPSDKDYAQRMQQIDDLKYFLATANDGWACPTPIQSPPYQVHTFPLATGEHISCVLWNNLYHITGTDIVRSLVFRFHAFGRPVQNLKKFEEGVFSDLRNLKPGLDACLEEPRSEFLDMLYKNNCIRTKKKQKVFYWFSVPHDRLFLDALERDLKREKLGIETTSVAVAEPATSLSLDSTQELFDHLRKSLSLVPGTSPSSSSSSMPAITPTTTTTVTTTPKSGDDLVDDQDDNDTSMQNAASALEDAPASKNKVWLGDARLGNDEVSRLSLDLGQPPILMQHTNHPPPPPPPPLPNSSSTPPLDKTEKRILQQHVFRPSRSLDLQMTKRIFGKLPLFDGSPTYKQRRHRAASVTQSGTTSPLSPALSSMEPDRKCDTSSNHHPKRSSSMIMTSRLAKAAIAAGHYHQQHDDPNEEDYSDDHTHMTDNEEDDRPSKTLISTSSYNALAKATSALASVMSDDPRARCTFTCPLHACGRLFRRLEQLKRHLRTHTLHRPHQCQTCGKRFSRSDNLSQHKKVHQKQSASTAAMEKEIHAGTGFVSNSATPTLESLYVDDRLAHHTDAANYHPMFQPVDDALVMEGPMMDFSFMDEGGSLNSSLCNSPVINVHAPYQKDYYHHPQPTNYQYFNSAASSIVPSPSSSTSSPYRSSLTQDYHYQLQQQQMQALQQALTSCMKTASPTTTTYQRPSQVPHRWSLPETTTTSSSSLLTSSFVPPFLFNDTVDDDWTQWQPLAPMDLNDLDAFASSS